MCELFALSSNYPTAISFSLEEFSLHGGATGPHKDGWGIAFFEDTDVRLIKEANAAASSPCLNFIQDHDFQSNIVISHIRKATQGALKLANTQPFIRELSGQIHVFIHNGDLKQIQQKADFQLSDFHPLGETDSEYAFCDFMGRMKKLWWEARTPTLKKRRHLIEQFAKDLVPLGPANFIYSDGEYIFAHGDKRTQPGKAGFHPPGLHYLCRSCSYESDAEKIKGLRLEREHDLQKVVLLASVPLSSEAWIPLKEGEVIVLRDGEVIT